MIRAEAATSPAPRAVREGRAHKERRGFSPLGALIPTARAPGLPPEAAANINWSPNEHCTAIARPRHTMIVLLELLYYY